MNARNVHLHHLIHWRPNKSTYSQVRGFTAQLAEPCTGNAGVKGSNPFYKVTIEVLHGRNNEHLFP